ncbi:MAG: hypothetical protein HXJ92_00025 [candidate division SR1 bacterium]|nr:hypothetical protein [candidate division SR1 bacterium]
MISERKIIKKLFDDTTVINGNCTFKINDGDYSYKTYYADFRKLMRELLDVALFCSQGGEDYREYIFSFGEYGDRFYIIFKGGVCCGGYYNMAVDCIFEKEIVYDQRFGLSKTEIFSGFYYIDTLDLTLNILELLDRSYKAQEIMKQEIFGDNRKEYVAKYRNDVKPDIIYEIIDEQDLKPNAIKDIDMHDANLEHARKIMKECFGRNEDYKKSEAEIAEKKCTIIKNLRFGYSDLDKFNHIPKYINRLAPIVDLHANDGGEYRRIGTNFVIIGDGSGIDIEV